MRSLLLTALVVMIACALVQCEESCLQYIDSLEQIHQQLINEAHNHNYNMQVYGGKSYVSRTSYILKMLNAEISAAQQESYYGSYSHNKYNKNGRGKPTNGCKELEDEILTKSREFGIEKIGLEDNLQRLRKVLQYQQDKSNFYFQENEECKLQKYYSEGNKTELEAEIQTLKANRAKLEKTIKSLNVTVHKLESDKKKLQAKINANSPAIHGTTGIEYPIGAREIVGTTSSTTTTEASAAVQNVTSETSSGDDVGSDQTSVIPDIDLRNSAS
uniref:Putative secreted protein n=1 Tax=Aedes aegypti TaxID=7159 RepID=Q1HQI6_AEDAE|nr:putative secreted protein [Aedes aegypti]